MIFLFYLTFVKAIHETQIYVGQSSIIQYFTQFGIIVSQNLTQIKGNESNHFCSIIPQQLVSYDMLEQSLPIIPQYLNNQFEQYFDNGHYIGYIPNIISFVNLNNDAIILTNEAQLIYIRFINDTFIVSDKLNLNINHSIFSYPIFMEAINEQLIIIMHEYTIGINITPNAPKIFSNLYRIFEVFNTSKITSLAVVNNMLFVAMGTIGIQIYQINNRIFSYLQFSFQINNATDLKIFHQYGVYFIYILDYDIGVQGYIYNPKTTLFYLNTKLTLIPYSGDILDIYENILMVANQKNGITTIVEIQINYTDNTWNVIKQHIVNHEIVDIDIVDHIAIILGNNENTIIYHSIPKDYESKQQHIIMPSLKKINFIKTQTGLYLIGISLHRFYYSKLEIISSYLQCYFDQIEETEFLYTQYSTQCEQQSEQICQFTQLYSIKSITPLLTTEHNAQIYIVLGIVVFCFLIILIVLIIEFRKYNHFVDNIQDIENKSPEITMQTQIYESPSKIIKFNQSGLHSNFSIISNIQRMQQIEK